jgi:long-chain acyl-CoA synthetase
MKVKDRPIMTQISAGIPTTQLDTWPKVLEYNFDKFADCKAMRYKHYGIWQSYSWRDYYLNVKYLALGLLSLGFEAGDKLLMVGDNAPEWYFGELAAQSNRGISVGAYADISSDEIKYIAQNSEARFALVEDQEQADKLVQIQSELPHLQTIIYWKYKGLSSQSNPFLRGYREVLDQGRDYEKTHPQVFEKNVANGKADDICAIIYTSGTTGDAPNGAMHSYKTLKCVSDHYRHLDGWNQHDNLISYLPPCWITEQWLAFGCHLLSASTTNFAESAETQQQDIREIGPSTVVYSGRLWERQAGNVQARIQGTGGLKKLAYRVFMPVGFRMVDFKIKKQKPGWHWRALYFLANVVLFRPMRDSLGLPHVRICYSSGSVLCPDAFRFYRALNIPLKNLYGSTEAGALTSAGNEDIRLDTVGPVRAGVEVKITPTGEIITRSPGMFLGYYNNPALTAEVLKDGWVYTGDSGGLTDDGQLVFMDRTKDIIQLACGETVYPQMIEARLKYSPYIKDACVLAGPERAYTTAVIVIDAENAGKWADKKKVSFTTFSDLAQKPEIYQLIEQEIARINADLALKSRVKRFVNLHKELDPDESELTRSRKLRRTFVEAKYGDLIRAIYSGQPSIEMEVQIRYQDGRVGKAKTILKILAVGKDKQ